MQLPVFQFHHQKINPGNPAKPTNPASLDTFNRIGSGLDETRIARDKIDDPRYGRIVLIRAAHFMCESSP